MLIHNAQGGGRFLLEKDRLDHARGFSADGLIVDNAGAERALRQGRLVAADNGDTVLVSEIEDGSNIGA